VIVGWDEFTTIVVALGLAFGTAAVLRVDDLRNLDASGSPTTPTQLGSGGST